MRRRAVRIRSSCPLDRTSSPHTKCATPVRWALPPNASSSSLWRVFHISSLADGAALLEMWNTRHKELDEAFGGSAHRTGVAHFVWGDEVRSSGQEDLILTARRRMIDVYNDTPEVTRQAPIGITVVSPLEAPPRVATSGPGDDRDGGARKHRGLDIAA